MKKIAALIAIFWSTLSVHAQTVAVDNFFNHETRKGADGQPQGFHYLWDDKVLTGFSKWGEVFTSKGADLRAVSEAPTAASLKGASVYIIVDPDTRKENPSPNFMTEAYATNIAAWVKRGGVLVLMANDSANCELTHFNILASKFGLHFNNDLQNHVIDDAHFDDGAVRPGSSPIFKTAQKLFLKDVCSITLTGKAKPALMSADGSVPIAATVKYGKGTVFAVGDPWLYNEYVNGRLPAGFDNDKAATDLAAWLLSRVPHPRK